MKYCPNSTVDKYKVGLIARGFTQTYGVDYLETFYHVARLNSIRILFSLAVNYWWSIFQLNVKNAFLYDDLDEEVYMEQSPEYVAQRENMVCSSRRLSMASSKAHKHGSKISAILPVKVVFSNVILVIRYSFTTSLLIL